MKEVIIAIDGGATKTDITIRRRDGTVLFNGQGEGSNYQTAGLEKMKRVLSSLLFEAKNAYPKMRVEVAMFALAGIDSEEDEARVQNVVRDVCRTHHLKATKLIIENDALATLFGVTEKKPGVLIIAGTGSIAYAHDAKGKIIRSGGWGHRVGDEGSGYWLGREVLRSIFKMEDGRGPSTSLKGEVLKKLRMNTVQEIAQWLYSPANSVDQVAKLSIILDQCVNDGDYESIRISKKGARELVLLIKSVLLKCELENGPCKVFINGGAIIHSKMRLNELEKSLLKEFTLCEVIVSTKSPIEYIVDRGWLELDSI